MNKQEVGAERPLVHGRMIYHCEQCGKSWAMFLEKGIEEFGEDHKPSPFTICCPYCGGWAMDVAGIQKLPCGGYMPLPDRASYFENREDRDCGVPVFYCGARQGAGSDWGSPGRNADGGGTFGPRLACGRIEVSKSVLYGKKDGHRWGRLDPLWIAGRRGWRWGKMDRF